MATDGTTAERIRKIIHVDMDAFFAAVEQRDDPSLRGKPVAVGGSRERGVVATASYEARRFGIRSAMPSVTARRMCPDLVFVKPRFEVYREVSRQIREIFADYTALIEPPSLDEAYLDVTENLKGIPYAAKIASEIRKRIFETTNLTASAGVSYNKFLAKMASDINKPDGMFVITPEMGLEFVEKLPVGKFHGIGPKTAERMNSMGIATGLDLRSKPLDFMIENFGKVGKYYHGICRGIDERQVNPNRIRKSVGVENTFTFDLTTMEEMLREMDPILDEIWTHVQRIGEMGRTATLKIKFDDFRQITRSKSVTGTFDTKPMLKETIVELLEGLFPMDRGVRLMGVSISGFRHGEAPQLAFDL
jgi:DNA polymerase-4